MRNPFAYFSGSGSENLKLGPRSLELPHLSHPVKKLGYWLGLSLVFSDNQWTGTGETGTMPRARVRSSMNTPKLALLSVSDKQGLAAFAEVLCRRHGYTLLSTGGTARLLQEKGLPVTEVGRHTGFPEIMDGRVKTLHPKIHGGLLCRRDKPDHLAQAEANGIALIDLVVVNLYPFEQTVARPDVSLEEAIENIDIGGPSMLRSAAKNHESERVPGNPASASRSGSQAEAR